MKGRGPRKRYGGWKSSSLSSSSRRFGFDPAVIAEHGAVSETVAAAMAEGARARSDSTFGLATTGIAGPGGGSEAKPVGTVYVALAGGGETLVRHLFFPTDRETFKQLASQTALNLLRERLA